MLGEELRSTRHLEFQSYPRSPNGRYLAYGSADHTIGILDATTLAVSRVLSGRAPA